MSGRIIPTILGKGWRFPGIGPLPTFFFFFFLDSALELSWRLWLCHLACWLRIMVQSEVDLSVILDTFDSNLFMLCPQAMSFFQKLCPAISTLGFSSMWTKNFQMYKLGLEKEEEPEIKLPTFTASWRKQGSSRRTSISAFLTMPKPLTVWSQQTVEYSSRDGNTRPRDLPPEKSVCRSGSNS